jgi:nucleoside-diphosphate-sugar epimerase
MKVLLTGATGFLGSHLLKKMLKTDFQVVILKRSFSDTSRIDDVLDDVNLTVFDSDKIEADTVFKENNFDAIVHVATEYGRNNTSIYKILETNLILPLKLVELGIKYNVKAFINTDSYFNKENTTYSNLLNYSLSKKSLLIWLKQLSKHIKVANVVLEHIYGPYDSNTKFVENLIQQVAIHKVNRVSLTHGHQKRDFIYVDDVTDAYITILHHVVNHDIAYNLFEIGTGNSIEVRELACLIKKISNSNTELGFGDIPYRSDEIMDSKASISHHTELGWNAKISLEEGIRLILKTYSQI